MKRTRNFHYQLGPALSARQWELDDLVLELRRLNSELSELQRECERMEEELDQVGRDWTARFAMSSTIDIGNMTVLRHYMRELADRRSLKKKEIEAMSQQRDTLMDGVNMAKRSVEVLEEHRIKMKKIFDQSCINEDFKNLDDQWSNLQAYRGLYET